MRSLISTAYLLLISAMPLQAVFAANISILPSAVSNGNVNNNHFLLSGEIRKGDADKLANAFIQAHPYPIELTLNSPGGDVEEALRIASLVKAIRLPQVEVESGGICASACFFIYLAADARNAAGTIDGRMDRQVIGYIGLHRPYFELDPTQREGSTDAERHENDLMKIISTYLRNEDVPQHLIDIMMSRSSSDIYWMTKNDIVELGYDKLAVEELLLSRCGDSDTKIAVDLSNGAALHQIKTRSRALGNCSITAFPDWDKERLKKLGWLRKGWRPWLRSKALTQ